MAEIPSAQNSTLNSSSATDHEDAFITVERDLRFLTHQDKWLIAKSKQNTMATDSMEADPVLFQGKLQC